MQYKYDFQAVISPSSGPEFKSRSKSGSPYPYPITARPEHVVILELPVVCIIALTPQLLYQALRILMSPTEQ